MAATGDGVILIGAALFPFEFTYLTGVQSRTAKLIIIPDSLAKQTPKPGAGEACRICRAIKQHLLGEIHIRRL